MTKYAVDLTACAYDESAKLSHVEDVRVIVRADSRCAAVAAAFADASVADFGALYVEDVRAI